MHPQGQSVVETARKNEKQTAQERRRNANATLYFLSHPVVGNNCGHRGSGSCGSTAGYHQV